MVIECAICGCSELNACVDRETGECCEWIAPGLCSFCEFAVLGFRAPIGPDDRLPLYPPLELVEAP